MGAITARLDETRSTLATPDAWLLNALIGGKTASGVSINADTALTLSAVYNAVAIIAGTVGALPLHLFRKLEPRGRERATDHPVENLLAVEPDAEVPPYYFWETLLGHVLLRGNGYAQIIRDGGSMPTALHIFDPRRVQPIRTEQLQLLYEIKDGRGQVIAKLPADQVLHIRGLGYDGLVGYPVIWYARESMGMGKAAEVYGAALFANSATPSGILSHPTKLRKEGRDKLREAWEAMHGGVGNAHRVAVLEEGLTWTAVGMDPKDSQFLQTRKFQIAEIARWFNLPMHKLKDLERTTNNNIEAENRSFIDDSIMPWLIRITQEVRLKLINKPERKIYFAEHILDARLRGDTGARYAAYASARQWGILSINEIRDKENMNPIPEGGDVYLQPLNMQPATDEPPEPPAKPEPPPPDDDEPERTTPAPLTIHALQPVLADALGRMLRKEAKAARRAAENPETFTAWSDEFYAGQQAYICAAIGPVLDSAAAILGQDEAWAHRQALDLAVEHVARSLSDLRTMLLDDLYCSWETQRAEMQAIAWLGRLAGESHG